jgi:hypothetical protein
MAVANAVAFYDITKFTGVKNIVVQAKELELFDRVQRSLCNGDKILLFRFIFTHSFFSSLNI